MLATDKNRFLRLKWEFNGIKWLESLLNDEPDNDKATKLYANDAIVVTFNLLEYAGKRRFGVCGMQLNYQADKVKVFFAQLWIPLSIFIRSTLLCYRNA